MKIGWGYFHVSIKSDDEPITFTHARSWFDTLTLSGQMPLTLRVSQGVEHTC
jgi:hypothetical protein